MDDNRDSYNGDGRGPDDRHGGGRRGPERPGPGGGFSQSLMVLLLMMGLSFFLMNMGRGAIYDTSSVEISFTHLYDMV